MRTTRQYSNTGLNHLIVKGINKQLIFEDAEDYNKFKEVLIKKALLLNVYILATVFMGNHVHIVTYTGGEFPTSLMRRVNTSYAMWFNRKYSREGPVFQGRFKSKPIETVNSLFRVLRYVYRNPVKAKLSTCVSDYSYTSYNDDFLPRSDLYKALQAIFAPKKTGIKTIFQKLKTYIETATPFENIKEKLNTMSDEIVKAVIFKVVKIKNASHFQSLPKEIRNAKLLALKKKGFFISQLSRLTGISIGIIEAL